MSNYYLESLDSVRTQNGIDKEDFGAQVNIIRLEFLYSLLFGNSIVIPEPFLFDSRGFLSVSRELLVNANISDWGSYYPIVLSNRGVPGKGQFDSFNNLIKQYAAKNDFIFSSIEEGEQENIKRELSQKGNVFEPGYLGKVLPPQYADSLARLSHYFGTHQDAFKGPNDDPVIDMESYIKGLMACKKEEFEENDHIKWKYVQKLQNIQRIVNRKFRADYRCGQINNRCIPRKYFPEKEFREYKDVYFEFVDTCYHLVVSSSVHANTGIYTPLISSTHQHQSYLLAIYIHEKIKRVLKTESPITNNNLQLVISLTEATPNFNGIWKNVGSIVKPDNDAFYDSLERLKLAIRTQSGVEEALEKHIEYLSKETSLLMFSKTKENLLFTSIKLGLSVVGGLIDCLLKIPIVGGVTNVLPVEYTISNFIHERYGGPKMKKIYGKNVKIISRSNYNV